MVGRHAARWMQREGSQVKEFQINISFAVDAHDYDEAIDIAKATRLLLERESDYKLRDVETQQIEEV